MEFRQAGPWHEPKPSDEGGILQPVESRIDVLHVTTKTPYKQINFWGTYIAAAAGALGCYGGFIMPATALSLIDAELGPSENHLWVVLAWTLCLAVGYTLVGRLSDIFGRRWFFIGATMLAVIGCAIGATAPTINVLIASSVFNGLAAAAQLSFNYTLTELVPIKHRFYVLTGVFLIAAPFSCFGPYLSRVFIVYTDLTWRWNYYANLIANGISLICYMAFYHPPDFNELHSRRRTLWQEIQDLDYIGMFLYTAGLLVFLMGLSWGGQLYPWASAQVIVTMIVGFIVFVVFVLYECHIPLKRPLIPMHLFRNVDYVVLNIVSAVGGMLYYALNVVYPLVAGALLAPGAEPSAILEQGLLTCAIGGGVALGQIAASVLATPGGLLRWKVFGSVLICTIFTAALAGAVSPGSKALSSGLAVVASICIGALESFAGVAVTIVIKDQTEIGAAAGAYGSIRSAAGVLATAILSSAFMSELAKGTADKVVPALLKTDIDPTAIEPLVGALLVADLDTAAQLAGSEEILYTAIGALTLVLEYSFKVMYLITLVWGIPSCIAAWFTPSIEDLYTDEVMRQLRDNWNQEEPNHVVQDSYPMPEYEAKGHVHEQSFQV